MVVASITGGIVNEIANFIREAGWPAVFVLMLLSAACIPVPSEVVMLFAGFAAADPTKSHAHLAMAVGLLAGLGGTVVGSWIAYGVGRWGRVELLERHGHWLHITPAQIQRVQGWFERYGEGFVFFGRLLPTIRSFVSLPAGVARMGFVRFTALTVVASAIWVAAFAYAGEALGSEWESIRKYFDYVDYVLLAALVCGALFLFFRRRLAAARGAAAVEE